MTHNKLAVWVPTTKQEAFTKVLFNSGTARTITKVCEEADVSRTTLYTQWLKDPKFLEYIQECRDKIAWFRAPRIDKALMDRAETGDTKAIQLFYKKFEDLLGEKDEVKRVVIVRYDGEDEE